MFKNLSENDLKSENTRALMSAATIHLNLIITGRK